MRVLLSAEQVVYTGLSELLHWTAIKVLMSAALDALGCVASGSSEAMEQEGWFEQ